MALGKACGRCHRSALPTAVPGALAVFDLSRDSWYEDMTDDQLRNLAGRVREAGSLDPADREAVACFVGYSLGGSCGSGNGSEP